MSAPLEIANKEIDDSIDKLGKATDILSYKWQPRILYAIEVLHGASFSEIKAYLDGISSKMLSENIGKLINENIIKESEPVEGSGVNVYEPTMKGRELLLILRLLIDWQNSYEEEQPELVMVKQPSVFTSPCENNSSNDFNIQKTETPKKACKLCTELTDIVIIDEAVMDGINDSLFEDIRDTSDDIIISLLLSPPLPEELCELSIDTIMLKPIDYVEFKIEIKHLRSRIGLTKQERKYLALRSKLATLQTVHANPAEDHPSYGQCEDQIEEISLPESRRQSLDNLLKET